MITLADGIATVDGDHLSHEIRRQRRLDCDGIIADIIPLLSQGNLVLDIGASMGTHTAAYLRHVGQNGQVFAFEPNPEYFDCLTFNCPTAIHINRPVWNNSHVSLYLRAPKENRGAGYVSTDSADTENLYDAPMRPVVIDEMGLSRLNFIKLDCEGAELHALEGARETIQQFRPKMVIEINRFLSPRFKHTHMNIYNLLDSWNYDYKSISNEPHHHCSFCDILCWPK